MCRNHHDFLETAVIESLPLRQILNPNQLPHILSPTGSSDPRLVSELLVSRRCPQRWVQSEARCRPRQCSRLDRGGLWPTPFLAGQRWSITPLCGSTCRMQSGPATPGSPLAWLRFEPARNIAEVRLQLWPGSRDRLLAPIWLPWKAGVLAST
jgi:hypothetical protein